MKRDKNFIKNSIKMDLFRVVTAAGDTTEEFPEESVYEFLSHADLDFGKMKLNKREKELRKELKNLTKTLSAKKDNEEQRLKWAEQVLTLRCRL